MSDYTFIQNLFDLEDEEADFWLWMAYDGSGHVKKELKDYQGALQDFSIAIKLIPHFYFVYAERATVKLELKDYLGAISDCTAAIKNDKNCAEAFHIRGIAKIALGRKRSGSEDIKIANSMGYL